MDHSDFSQEGAAQLPEALQEPASGLRIYRGFISGYCGQALWLLQDSFKRNKACYEQLNESTYIVAKIYNPR